MPKRRHETDRPRHPQVHVNLAGEDGNAFAILGRVQLPYRTQLLYPLRSLGLRGANQRLTAVRLPEYGWESIYRPAFGNTVERGSEVSGSICCPPANGDPAQP